MTALAGWLHTSFRATTDDPAVRDPRRSTAPAVRPTYRAGNAATPAQRRVLTVRLWACRRPEQTPAACATCHRELPDPRRLAWPRPPLRLTIRGRDRPHPAPHPCLATSQCILSASRTDDPSLSSTTTTSQYSPVASLPSRTDYPSTPQIAGDPKLCPPLDTAARLPLPSFQPVDIPSAIPSRPWTTAR